MLRMTTLKSQPIFLLGFGGVGRALARQIIAARDLHARRNTLHLKVIGVADSASSIVEPSGLSDAVLNDILERKSRGEHLAPDPWSVVPRPSSQAPDPLTVALRPEASNNPRPGGRPAGGNLARIAEKRPLASLSRLPGLPRFPHPCGSSSASSRSPT